MRVAINGFALINKKTRAGRYMTETLQALSRFDRKNTYEIFVPKPVKLTLGSNFTITVVPFSGESELRPFNNFWWQRYVLAKVLRERDSELESRASIHGPAFDLVHSFDVVTPKTRLPAVGMLHDASLWELSPGRRLAMRWLPVLPAHIITVSGSLRKQISHVFARPLDTIRVVSGSYNQAFTAMPELSIIEKAQSNFGIDGPFVLSVGRFYRRGNIKTVVAAFAKAKKYNKDLKLVFVGLTKYQKSKLTYSKKEIRQLARGYGIGESVVVAGAVPREQLSALYHLAVAVINLHAFIGFPLTSLEALSAGAGVLSPDLPVYHEVLGQAPVYYRHESARDLAKKIQGILRDDSAAKKARKNAPGQLAKYSWKQSAKDLLMEWERIVDKNAKNQ